MPASVTQNRDYLMLDNSHYMKTTAETVSTYHWHCILILCQQNNEKTCAAQAFEELCPGKSHKTGLKYLLNQSSELTLVMHVSAIAIMESTRFFRGKLFL